MYKIKNDLILRAIEYIKSNINEFVNSNGYIKSEYKGYIDSMGPSIIQSGLLPTILFYQKNENTQDDKKEDRSKINKAVFYVIEKQLNIDKIKDMKLHDYIINNIDKEKDIRRYVLESIAALKLAIKTFKIEKN
jgi:CRISPR-associated protein Cmr5